MNTFRIYCATAALLHIFTGPSYAKEASLVAYCLSVDLAHSTATLPGLALDSYFTSYDGSAGVPLYDLFGNLFIFSNELSPNPSISGGYRTDYILFANGAVDSSGTASILFPVTDDDANGVPDFLQVSRSGSVSFSGTVSRQLPSVSAALPLTGQITRSANSSVGSFVANVRNSQGVLVTYRGSSFLLNATGTIAYERNGNSAEIIATLSNEDGTSTSYSASTTFQIVNANTIVFPPVRFSGSNLRVVQSKAFTLIRSNKRYLGNIEFEDGGLSTSWRDYVGWRMEILDPNDADGDGIPDLSAPVDATKPTVTINQSLTQSDPANGSQVSFSVVFSEPVTGFGPAGVSISGSAGPTTVVLTGSAATYTATVSGMRQSGLVTASVLGGAAHDAAGNFNFASTSIDHSVFYNAPDTTRPSVTINQAPGQTDPTSDTTISFNVVFSEAVIGFGPAGVSVTGSAGATVVIVTGSGANYSVKVSGMQKGGSVIATVLASAAHDAAGNMNFPSASLDNDVSYNWLIEDASTDAGKIRFSFHSEIGRIYEVQTSSTLPAVGWSTISNITSTSTLSSFSYERGRGLMRFYRVKTTN